ncbi:heparan sulfate glucosamine 3-O-sulfotransferase 1-like [Ylistrum balloti]|uniref:heparan sulfate glucosamine 3-O-sulfotransferase 1-like n=1 Tax=Ylistrum balloti TaxID=509963 RepID=UPI002905EA01|nr:heparan sulfate glucosamine 3-O-sulfotransferase 1-like [Ylistrum balloti]XP_060083502.1 heparan sulfate glucosamine 3-O-sulfotransferase 1-like [Ylistrum balloti]XP_060083503.1 heparan sulfate glucosamine 3-O-sulfotransferase 1-like [Ylistrum balloti]XP_060083504.1 heparan sulfate glucosamine 3-O-sulfotransferase 1-like [Ylistrum balloti]
MNMSPSNYIYHEEAGLLPRAKGFCCRRFSKTKILGLLCFGALLLFLLTLSSPDLSPKDNYGGKRQLLPNVVGLFGPANKPGRGGKFNTYIQSNIPVHKKTDLRQRLPQCLIIGVKKAGTGAMVQYLKLHPDIVIADKELNFFDYERNFKLGFDYYKTLMPPSYEGQITMEKTSNYFHNKDTEWRVYSMNTSMKMILLVREPIARAVSDYLQRKQKDKSNKELTPSFEELIIRQKNGKINEGYPGIRPSFYYKHMVRWLKYFPLTQIHIVDGDNLVRNPYEEVHAVEKFLGLPHLITPDRFVFSDKKGFYCMSIDGVNGTRQEQCLSKGKGRKHPDVDKRVMEMLTDLFKPLNEQFYNLIGRKFNW